MMEGLQYARPPRSGTSSIYNDQPSRRPNYIDSGRAHPMASVYSPASGPMSIPRPAQEGVDAPPPLPPPKNPLSDPFDHSPRYPSYRHSRGFSRDSETSSYGSLRHSPEVERPDYRRNTSDRTITNHRDEGYHSLASTLSQPQDSIPKKRFMSHDQFQFRPGGNDYDNSLLKKLDPRRTLDRSPPGRSALSASANDALQRVPSDHRGPLPPLSLPIRSNTGSYLAESPAPLAISTRGLAVYADSSDYRSPIDPTDLDRSPPYRTKRTNSGSLPDDITVTTQGSCENMGDDTDFPMEETSGIRRLHIDERFTRADYQTIGQKRRALSPPSDELPLQGLPGAGEIFRRREGASRASPNPRLTIPQSSVSSLSSLSSAARSGSSYTSNLTLAVSTASSMGSSIGRRSPGGLSPGALSPVDGICNSPFNTPISLTQSPRSAISRISHQRQLSENRPLASPRKLTELPKSNTSRIQGFFMCECCPKKPKKFETAEELNAHEAEKQYECSFCHNRFKNKNEAERHQNSLHVRRHSWSCSALHVAGYDKAFHDSANRPGESDACGYCGEEFARSGGSGRARHATDQDWEGRLRHLQETHKFRECNSSKKFYRADHFRQHLKHSHAGTSGKWTNMLETACMIEEDPPQPR